MISSVELVWPTRLAFRHSPLEQDCLTPFQVCLPKVGLFFKNNAEADLYF